MKQLKKQTTVRKMIRKKYKGKEEHNRRKIQIGNIIKNKLP